jgi:glycine/D-amino acid oxidase-like deaminating enzyme
MNKKIGVIGGGIVGSSIAYFLSRYREAEVTLFEKATIGSGTTAKSAATFCLIDDSVAHEFWSVRLFGFKFYAGLEADEPGSTGFEQTGTLTVAPYRDYEMYVKQAVDLTVASGYKAEYWLDQARIHEIIPDLNLEGVLGAGWCPDDGFFDATMIANTLVRRARENGADILTGTKVEDITTHDDKVDGVTTDKGHFDLDVVIDATGPWARTTAGFVGLDLPLWHTKAEVFILVPAAGLGYPFPVLKYPRFYARKDKDNIFICKAHMTMDLSDETHAGIWDPDDLPMTGGTDAYFWEFLTGELLEVFPRLLESSIGNEWVGYRAEPADFLPILGGTPVEGYLLAAGAGGNGVIEGPTIGRDMARFVMTGEKSWYLERLPLSRFADLDKVVAEAQASKLQR